MIRALLADLSQCRRAEIYSCLIPRTASRLTWRNILAANPVKPVIQGFGIFASVQLRVRSDMDREGFLRLLSKHFYPLIRAEGFKGSGSTLRRIDGPLLHIINIQGSSAADGFYVNLAALGRNQPAAQFGL